MLDIFATSCIMVSYFETENKMNIVKRMWINQPSTLQPFHHLHGTNVLAHFDEKTGKTTVYFLDGETVSSMVPNNVLAGGWQ
jgi:hypothetical protein